MIAKVFEQFSKDLEETHTQDNMVTTGTTVCFNIGGQRYSRRRAFMDGDHSSATQKKLFMDEEIIPKVEYTLLKFNAERQKSHPYAYVVPDKPLVNSSKCSITFTCLFCKEIFGGLDGWDLIQGHLEKEHCHEYCVYCSKCNSNYGMRELAANRWKHQCKRQ